MSECINNVTKSLIKNINEKAKELSQISIVLERMGVFKGCTEQQRNQYKELVKEITVSSQGIEHFMSISQNVQHI